MPKTIKDIQVIDAEKRRVPSKHYVYVVVVTWSEGTVMTVYRRYSRFFDLQTQLLDKFPVEAGTTDPTLRIIPFLPGKIFFGRSQIRDVAMKRLGEIDAYCKSLLRLPSHISECEEVLEFFEAEPDDIDPPKEVQSDNNEGRFSVSLNFLGSKHKGEKKGEKISDPKRLEQFMALADYQPQEKGELKLSAGMIVEVTEKTESGWWFCNAEDQQGWVPSTYLKPLNGTTVGKIPLATDGTEEKFLCIERYTANSEDEISLDKGVVVDVIQKTMDGWWRVRYQGQEGYAPATYLKKSSDPYAHNLVNKSRHSGVQIIGNLADVSSLLGGSSVSPRNSGHFAFPKVDNSSDSVAPYNPSGREPYESAASGVSESLWDDEWDDDDDDEEEKEDGYSKPSQLRTNQRPRLSVLKQKQKSLDRGGSIRPPPRQNSVMSSSPPILPSAKQKSSLYVTVADFEDTVGDGISFSIGETVTVFEKTSTGWWFVQRGSEQGWVPESFLQESGSPPDEGQVANKGEEIANKGEEIANKGEGIASREEDKEEMRSPPAFASALNAQLKAKNKIVDGGDCPDLKPQAPFKLPGKLGGGVDCGGGGGRPPPLPPVKPTKLDNASESQDAATAPSPLLLGRQIGEKPGLPRKPGEKSAPPSVPSEKPVPPVLVSKPAKTPKTGRPSSGAPLPLGGAGLASALKSRFESHSTDDSDLKSIKPAEKPSFSLTHKLGPPSAKPGADSGVSLQSKTSAPNKPFGKPSLPHKPIVADTNSNADDGSHLQSSALKLPSSPPKLPSKPQGGSKAGADANNNNNSIADSKPPSGRVHSMAANFAHANLSPPGGDSAGSGTKPSPPSKKPGLPPHTAAYNSGSGITKTPAVNIPGKPKVGNLVNELGSKLHFGGAGGQPLLGAAGGGADGAGKAPEIASETWPPKQQTDGTSKSPEKPPMKKSVPGQAGGVPRPTMAAPPPPPPQSSSTCIEYLVIGDFSAQGQGEVDLKDGDVVEVIDQQQEGWWFVRLQNGDEGWAPSTYLEPAAQWDN